MKKELSKKELQSLIYTDELTKVFNLRYFRDETPRYLETAKENGWTVGFFMLDIDDFKNVNDNHGHLVGDKALTHFTQVVIQSVDEEGVAIRYAGDEFILLVPRIDRNKAAQLGEQIQRNLKLSPLTIDQQNIGIQCSLGISLFPQDGDHLKTLFEKADEALYVAKERGKGTVVVTPESGRFLTPTKLNSILDSPYIVGRDDLIQFLQNHLSPKGDSTEFPVLMGAEGTGKTRLLRYAQAVSQDTLKFILEAKGYPFWQSDLYGAVFASLEHLFEQQRAISDRVFSQLDDKYRQALKPHLPNWSLKTIESTETEKKSDSLTLFEALTQAFFILREMGDGAVLLDDIDQIDTPSLQFFGSQFGHSKGGILHFVSSMRSPDLTTGEEKLLSLLESMPELTSSSRVLRLPLQPLNTEQLQQLVAKLFHGKALPQNPAEAILRNSSGSPLFIIETISSLLLEGKIRTKGEEWDLSEIKPQDIPINLNEMLKARILRMDAETVEVLKIASILGERIQAPQLAELLKLKVHQVLNALSDAQRALIIEEGPNPDEYVFSHRVSRTVLYSMIDEKERRRHHIRAAELEQQHAAGAPERIVGRLAYHFHNAGQLEKAAEMFSKLKQQMEAVHISRGTRKILQRRIHSVALAKESSLEKEDLSTALMIGRTFRSCMQNIRLYPKENENVKNSLTQFMNHLVPFLAEKTEALAVSLTAENILFNGQPLPPYLEDARLTQDLYVTMTSFGLQGILFLRGITQDEVVGFLEIFKRLPEDVIGQWDSLLEQLNIRHIFPDRKVFVAVSERKIILDDQKITVQSPGEGDGSDPAAAGGGAPLTTEQMGQLKTLFDQFQHEKQELLAALETGGITGEQMQSMVQLLSQTDLGQVAGASTSAPTGSPSDLSGAMDRYGDIDPDLEFVKEVENDISLAFEDLASTSAYVRAKAAAWLAQQPTTALAEAGYETITSDLPIRFRKLAAEVIKKAGEEASTAFLNKLNIGIHIVPLTRALRICDIFSGHPRLLPVLRDLGLKGATEAVPPILNVLKKVQGDEADSVLLDIFRRSSDKMRWNIMPLLAERKIEGAIPLLREYIKPAPRWEKEKNISLQEEVCRTLGVFRSLDTAEALIAAAAGPSSFSLNRVKPESVRATATWALTQLPRDHRVDAMLAKLKSDRSDTVRKAAEFAELFRE
jgi:diguanylate cyclase (GGDEF)-like protein